MDTTLPVDPRNTCLEFNRRSLKPVLNSTLADKGVDSTHLLGILIFNGLDRVAKVIANRMTPQELNAPLSEWRVSCLQCAIMLGNQPMTEYLIGRDGIQLDYQDKKGFSALHHAALTANDTAIALLIAKGANGGLLNFRNGSYADISRMTRFANFFRDDTNIPCGSQKAYRRMVGAFFSHEIYTPANVIADDYANGHSRGAPGSTIFKAVHAQYSSFVAARPKLLIKKVEGVGFDVIAGGPIKKGAIICEYSGYDVSMEKPADAKAEEMVYQMGIIDGDYPPARIRGYGPLINDSFPNATALSMEDLAGRDVRPLVIALEDVREGDRICINYGRQASEKTNWHVELRVAALEAFFRKHRIVDVIDKIRKCPVITNSPHFSEITQLFYLVHTPIAVVRLFLKDIISIDDLSQLDLIQSEAPATAVTWSKVVKPALIAVSSGRAKRQRKELLQLVEKGTGREVMQRLAETSL